jgi:WD40 repeat protein
VAVSLGVNELDNFFEDLGIDEIVSELGIDALDSVEERQPERVIGGHNFRVGTVVFSPDGTRFITADLHNALRLWDAETFALIEEYEDSISGYNHVKFIGDGSTFVGISSGGEIYEWTAATGALVRSNTAGGIHTAIMRDDGQQYAAITYNNYGLSIRQFPSGTQVASDEVGDYVSGGAYSPSGEYLVLMATAGELHVFETNTWRLIYQDEAIGTSAETLEFIPNTNSFVVANSGELEIYEIENSTVSPPETWNVDDDLPSTELLSIDSIAFSPDGQYLAMGNFFDNVYVWDFEERKLLLKLLTENAPESVDFSGDGTRVISGSTFEGQALIWDVSDLGD